ncbi:uncharacterized protein B0H18DRAFT_994776 [Fomitopsis serialis]|uniref:uncharacterized protein n=1 Tax=Fomitopsis serialis TaxID=139415 RepID=UPI0020088B25|nr:uncharacterized protein B0H18DRAFT_994776 [Neoantrodia serialis]KAH9930004.1 hypothetical protein B0H18DRAFT_994776 [Neoantrodia serialis]
MGQYWRLINIDIRQSIRFDSPGLSEMLIWRDPNRLIWLLAIPRKPKPYQRSVERGHSKDARDLGMLNLPFDVLDLIFDQIDDSLDVAYLALTNSFLRVIGEKHIYRWMCFYNGRWNLERLIYAGDCLLDDDLPPNVFKEKEKELLSGHNPDPKSGICNSCLFDAFDIWLNDKEERQLTRAERRELRALVELDYTWDGTPETEWILCNWTLAQYVRASAVADLTGSVCDGPWTDNFLGLGHVLLSQICWSSDMQYEQPIRRGEWAGHYVAITTVDQLTRNRSFADKENWTDVTDKVVGEVLEIWRAKAPERLVPHLRPEGYLNDRTPDFTDEEFL